jgi:hypothetical protein
MPQKVVLEFEALERPWASIRADVHQSSSHQPDRENPAWGDRSQHGDRMVAVIVVGCLLVAFIGLSIYGLVANAQPASFIQTPAPVVYRSTGDVESEEDYLARMRFQEFSEHENTAQVELVQQDESDQA